MILYPAIDLKDGQCVRLLHGDMDKATVFGDDPAAQGTPQARSYVQWDEIEEQVITAFDDVRQEQLNELNDRLAAWRSSEVEEERKWAEFIGYYIEGYDDSEIASRMGWTNQGTVRNWRSKIIRKLAELVGERRS